MESELRVLVAIGFTGLLVLLRLDAERFGAADYDEPSPEGVPSLRRRLAWYVIGIGLVLAIALVHPEPERDLRLSFGEGFGALFGGVLYAAVGCGQAVGIALLRYARVRLPPPSAYPGAVVNDVATAFIDEAAFRGALLGLITSAGIDANTAILVQALAYALATRLGARGRDPYGLALALGIGFLGGWLTIATGGIAAAFFGHAVTRVAVFVCTSHAGQVVSSTRDPIEVERRRRLPDGWRVVGTGGPRGR